MPFTLAHPAAALLFRRTPLPLAAVVAGTMAPDVPVFLNAYGRPYNLTHSVTGVLTVDLVVAVTAVVLWFAVLRDPVVDLLPSFVRERFDPAAHCSRRQWLLVAPAAVVGSLTHVGWDLFTHHDRWGVDRIGWLREEHGGLFGYQWAQYGSSVVGLSVCTLWALLALRGRSRRPHPRIVAALGTRALVIVGSVALASGLAAGLNAPEPGLRFFLGQTAIVGTIIGAAGLVTVAAIWQVLHRTGSRRPS